MSDAELTEPNECVVDFGSDVEVIGGDLALLIVGVLALPELPSPYSSLFESLASINVL